MYVYTSNATALRRPLQRPSWLPAVWINLSLPGRGLFFGLLRWFKPRESLMSGTASIFRCCHIQEHLGTGEVCGRKVGRNRCSSTPPGRITVEWQQEHVFKTLIFFPYGQCPLEAGSNMHRRCAWYDALMLPSPSTPGACGGGSNLTTHTHYIK